MDTVDPLVLYFCPRCTGLYVTRRLLNAHTQRGCDGSAANSGAERFAVDAETLLRLRDLKAAEPDVDVKVADETVAEHDDVSHMVTRSGRKRPQVRELKVENVTKTEPQTPQKRGRTSQSLEDQTHSLNLPQESQTPQKQAQISPSLEDHTDSSLLPQEPLPEVAPSLVEAEEQVATYIIEPPPLTNNVDDDDDEILDNLDHGLEPISDDIIKSEELVKTKKAPTTPAKTAKEWKERTLSLWQKYESYVVENTVPSTSGKPAKPGKRKYQCPHCKFSTTMVGHFDRHISRRHSETGIFSCDKCGYQNTLKSLFKSHLITHEKPFICDTCGDRFTSNKDLSRHQWKHTGDMPFQCELCDFKTRFKERMTIHRRKHTGERLLCDVDGCSFRTQYENALREHRRARHRMGKVLQCDKCPYSTTSVSGMAAHTRNHGLKNYQCSACDYQAVTRQMVIRHFVKHTQEKAYKCNKCHYAAGSHSAFKQHMMAHEGIKPFKCSNCSYHSVTRQKIQRHIGTREPCHRASVVSLGLKLHLDLSQYRQPVVSKPDDEKIIKLDRLSAQTENPIVHHYELRDGKTDESFVEEKQEQFEMTSDQETLYIHPNEINDPGQQQQQLPSQQLQQQQLLQHQQQELQHITVIHNCDTTVATVEVEGEHHPIDSFNAQNFVIISPT